MNFPGHISIAAPVSRPADAPEDIRDQPILSLCIPTYNRAPFLDYLLTSLARDCAFAFPFEVVVSDNASTDNTAEIVARHQGGGLALSYVRQDENKGGMPNLMTAFRRARGRYVMYLADDDLIDAPALAETIAYLRANPEIRACYTPWELYDDVTKQPGPLFFDLPEDFVIHPGQELDLLGHIINTHIFPETVIYRADAVRDISSDSRFCYWAFSYLAHVVQHGPVAFRRKHYYRSVTASPVAARIQAGHEQTMNDWDCYRGGLEYFVYALLRRAGTTLSLEQKRAFRDMIDIFVETRMRVALRLWLGRGDFLRAYELICRIHYLDPKGVGAIDQIEKLPLLILAQTLAWLANGIAGLDRIQLDGVEDGQSVAGLLREMGLERRILVSPAVPHLDAAAKRSSLVFIHNEDARQHFLDEGYLPGLIVSERELRGSILLG
ncbi:glycosyltransferase family 2 protein [Roseixanthobacter glucoisosaccharinicivorans]|uniref:glycosyltransferase family 2 protein n=1 Tax=Roseixanthobacter glucoisosaccharinicivorans TaxID=3119923 RepID=UPI00372C2766